jgi:glycogen debranching enzyme
MEVLAAKFGEESNGYTVLSERVKESFNNKFWNEKDECLYDVIDEFPDSQIRPNQIWAVSLPFTMLPCEKEKLVVQKVIKELYASYGLRSLSQGDKEYKGIYEGAVFKRDMAYHQGTVWSFPLGALVTAYCKVYGYTNSACEFAKRLIEPIEDHLFDCSLGTVSEIFDGNEPIRPRGCFAQAWGVGEILRAYVEDVLIPLKEFHC